MSNRRRTTHTKHSEDSTLQIAVDRRELATIARYMHEIARINIRFNSDILRFAFNEVLNVVCSHNPEFYFQYTVEADEYLAQFLNMKALNHGGRLRATLDRNFELDDELRARHEHARLVLNKQISETQGTTFKSLRQDITPEMQEKIDKVKADTIRTAREAGNLIEDEPQPNDSPYNQELTDEELANIDPLTGLPRGA